MRISLILVVGIGLAGTAEAQNASPAPQTQGLGGPVVAGVCLVSREAVFANAKVGQAATARLRVLSQEAQAEVDRERQPIETEIKTFQGEAARLSAEQRQAREQALSAKLQPLQLKAAQRQREIEATRVKALDRVSTEIQPVIAQIYRQRNCGLLVDRNSVIGGNMANDLTAAVVQGLDSKISTITFNREALPAAPAASGS
jgi:Skp family chaperone for outer membrane proteins